MNTLARLFKPLNKQQSRKDLTGDEWRQDRGGMKTVRTEQPAESTKSKRERHNKSAGFGYKSFFKISSVHVILLFKNRALRSMTRPSDQHSWVFISFVLVVTHWNGMTAIALDLVAPLWLGKVCGPAFLQDVFIKRFRAAWVMWSHNPSLNYAIKTHWTCLIPRTNCTSCLVSTRWGYLKMIPVLPHWVPVK